ncbi:PE family protein [Mycobacterium lepromatosis]|uniref:PE family protein n=1 Tax=Mycobacterium lepromatosis TaxID=480418 RepID=UPI0005F7E852|nr:PE family protein [Mycobacterium lepromatosis]
MSFLSVLSEQIESVVQGLAGIRSTLFGDFGWSLQVFNAQVTVFHDEFVTLLWPIWTAYLSSEAVNAAAEIAVQ